MTRLIRTVLVRVLVGVLVGVLVAFIFRIYPVLLPFAIGGIVILYAANLLKVYRRINAHYTLYKLGFDATVASMFFTVIFPILALFLAWDAILKVVPFFFATGWLYFGSGILNHFDDKMIEERNRANRTKIPN